MTNSTDLTFITNDPGNTLFDRFGTLLKDDTRYFDCLVAYFYISGFYNIYPLMEKVERIRILVGLKTDRSTYEFLTKAREQTGQMILTSHALAIEESTKDLLKDLELSADTIEIEKGVMKFIDWVRSGKLKIKAHPSRNLHAKLYIMTFHEGDRDKGRVITGSSNLTQSGLKLNLEFNVELKNPHDYGFALQRFDELWKTAVDISDQFEDTLANKSQFAHFTPYDLYLKFLYEYFQSELSRPTDLDDIYAPPDFIDLQYQEDAVLNARKVLDEYGGVFLSDVVGLGKTYMSALLAQQLDGRHLVIAPPHLLDKDKKGSWPNVFSDFQVRQTEFESIGKLEHLLKRDVSKFTNVFIDESHRFRTETTKSYELLSRICRGKRVILVSATPLNNRPRDILSQVKLFQNGKASTIPNLRNLDAFFSNLESRLKDLDRQLDREEYFRVINENAKETRERVLKYLMIRRTRGEIQKYYGDDLAQQGFKFPEIENPQPLFYQLNKEENVIFDKTILLLVSEFKYSRYTPLMYYEGEKDESELQGQRNIAGFMKVLIVKRLESSFHAFRLTLDRFIHSYEYVITEYHNGHVFISKKHIQKIFQALEEENHELIERLLAEDKARILDADDFSDDFIRDLKRDLAVLNQVRDLWKKITRDPKWKAFREFLTDEELIKSQKLIIFSESNETAMYLADRIENEVEPKVVQFSGQSSKKIQKAVISNFDANAYRPRDDYRVLVSTEVLAEGVNLHRSNIVINYDIPWNPTKLIQRVGRVNRVDTKFDTIYTYTFFPTQESNDLIKLKEAAEAKIHGFIEMLGADARLLTEGEEIKSHDLIGRLTSKMAITGEDEDEESELEYLSEIQDVRENYPDLYSRIKYFPKKARSTRSIQSELAGEIEVYPSLLTYFRQGRLDKFYLVHNKISEPVELDFLSAARLLRPNNHEEKRKNIGEDFYNLLKQNKDAFIVSTTPELDIPTEHQSGRANDVYVLRRLKANEIRKYYGFTDEDEAYIQKVIALLANGALPKPTTKKLANALKKEAEPLNVLEIIRRGIPPEFFEPTVALLVGNVFSRREVILSSYLVKA